MKFGAFDTPFRMPTANSVMVQEEIEMRYLLSAILLASCSAMDKVEIQTAEEPKQFYSKPECDRPELGVYCIEFSNKAIQFSCNLKQDECIAEKDSILAIIYEDKGDKTRAFQYLANKQMSKRPSFPEYVKTLGKASK